MKKLLLVLIALSLFTLSVPNVGASEQGFQVNFIARFDNENSEIEMTLENQGYASKVSFAESMASIEDYTFAFWIVNGVVRNDLDVNHEFVVTRNLTVEAIFSKANEHAVLFMDANTKLLNIQYVADGENAVSPYATLAEVPVNKPGYIVSDRMWLGNMESINADTVLVLEYVLNTNQLFTLNLVNDGSYEYLYDSVVTLQAETKIGQHFSHWKRDGKVVSFDETYKLSVLNDTQVEAVYAAAPVTAEPVIYMSEELDLRTGYVSYLSQFHLPVGYNLVEYGILGVNGLYVGFDMDTNYLHHDVVKYQGVRYFNQTNEFLLTFRDTLVKSARAYLVYEHEGNIHEVYSEVPNALELRVTPTFIGSPVSKVEVYNPAGGFFQVFDIYFDDYKYPSVTSGEINLPTESMNSIDRYVVVIDGVKYPVEVR